MKGFAVNHQRTQENYWHFLRGAWGRPAGLRDQGEREMGRFMGFDHHLRQIYGPHLGFPPRDWRDVCPPGNLIRTIRLPKAPRRP